MIKGSKSRVRLRECVACSNLINHKWGDSQSHEIFSRTDARADRIYSKKRIPPPFWLHRQILHTVHPCRKAHECQDKKRHRPGKQRRNHSHTAGHVYSGRRGHRPAQAACSLRIWWDKCKSRLSVRYRRIQETRLRHTCISWYAG